MGSGRSETPLRAIPAPLGFKQPMHREKHDPDSHPFLASLFNHGQQISIPPYPTRDKSLHCPSHRGEGTQVSSPGLTCSVGILVSEDTASLSLATVPEMGTATPMRMQCEHLPWYTTVT